MRFWICVALLTILFVGMCAWTGFETRNINFEYLFGQMPKLSTF